MGYHLNRLDEPALMAVPKPMQTEFDIHHRLESCAHHSFEVCGCILLLVDQSDGLFRWCRRFHHFAIQGFESLLHLLNVLVPGSGHGLKMYA